MLTRVKGSKGQVGWLGGNGRPDLAAGHSIIAGGYKDESPLLIGQCNQCVKQAQAHKIAIRVWTIPIQDLRMVTFCDSSFDFQGVRHQQGWLSGYTNRSLNANEKAPGVVSLLVFKEIAPKGGFTSVSGDVRSILCECGHMLVTMSAVLDVVLGL